MYICSRRCFFVDSILAENVLLKNIFKKPVFEIRIDVRNFIIKFETNWSIYTKISINFITYYSALNRVVGPSGSNRLSATLTQR